MKIPGWVPSSIHTLPSAKRDAALLPALYLFNFFVFSSWPQLGDVATEPWLILVWLYGLAVLVPLAWRDRAPVAVFIIQWVLTLAAGAGGAGRVTRAIQRHVESLERERERTRKRKWWLQSGEESPENYTT